MKLASLPYLTLLLALLGGPACSQTPGADEAVYVASSRGEVYYWVGCDAWRSLAPQNLRWFATAREAEAAGYRRSQARGCAGPEAAAEAGPAETGICTVDRVVDGDTLVCRESAERLRLLLVDAPELDQGEWGDTARLALERLLPPGTRARVELDVQERDRFGRLLAYLYTPGGALANEELARLGYAVAVVYPPNVRHIDRVRRAVEEARRQGRGLWSGSAFDCEPADHRAGRCP